MKMRTFYKKIPLFIKNYTAPTYKKLKPPISPFIKKTIFLEIIETPEVWRGGAKCDRSTSDALTAGWPARAALALAL